MIHDTHPPGSDTDTARTGASPQMLVPRRSALSSPSRRGLLSAGALGVGALAASSASRGAGATDAADLRARSGPLSGGAKVGQWVRLGVSPLSPRENSVFALVGDDLVVVGGHTSQPCHPFADCIVPPETFDGAGAAFSRSRGTWRRITPAPVSVAAPPRRYTGLRERLYILADGYLLCWDRSIDRWSILAPPTPLRWGSVFRTDSALVLSSGSDEAGVIPDQVFDVSSQTWSTLPLDPLRPAFDRTVTATPHGLVLTCQTLADDGIEDPTHVRAAILPPGSAQWSPLPGHGRPDGDDWAWSGDHLVEASVESPGLPMTRGARLDPVSGVWSMLPSQPVGEGGWPVSAREGPRWASGGWLYDDRSGVWTRLAAPPDGPSHPGIALWAGETLVVYGGWTWQVGALTPTPDLVWSRDLWVYRPA